jgi:hypothetical protein
MRDDKAKKLAMKMAEVVLEQLDDGFENIKILDVKADYGIDEDGDRVMKVFVVFDGAPKRADIEKLSGIERKVRIAFEAEADEDTAPIFSFISKEDAKSMKFETA